MGFFNNERTNVAKKNSDFYDYTDASLKPGKVDPMGAARDSGGASRAPKYKYDSNIEITQYKADDEKHMAKILSESQRADGLGVFTKKNPYGKKI
jgi:hypothetical protein